MSEVPEFTIEVGGEEVRVPAELPLLSVRNTVVFPGTTLPLNVGRPRSLAAVRKAASEDGLLAILTQRVAREDDPGRGDLYETGTLVRTLQMVDTGVGLSVVVLGLARFRVLELLGDQWRVPIATAAYGLLSDSLAKIRNVKPMTPQAVVLAASKIVAQHQPTRAVGAPPQ